MAKTEHKPTDAEFLIPRSTTFRSSDAKNTYPPVFSQMPVRILWVEGNPALVFALLILPMFKLSWYLVGFTLVLFLYLKKKRIKAWQVPRILERRYGEKVCYPDRTQLERKKGVCKRWPY